MDSDMSFLYGAAGGGVVGAVVFVLACVAVFYLKRLLEERDRLAAERDAALRKEVADVSGDLKRHLGEDSPKTTDIQLKNILGQLEKFGNKMDRQAEQRQIMDLRIENRLSSLERGLEEAGNFTKNLYGSMQKIRDDKREGKTSHG